MILGVEINIMDPIVEVSSTMDGGVRVGEAHGGFFLNALGNSGHKIDQFRAKPDCVDRPVCGVGGWQQGDAVKEEALCGCNGSRHHWVSQQ